MRDSPRLSQTTSPVHTNRVPKKSFIQKKHAPFFPARPLICGCACGGADKRPVLCCRYVGDGGGGGGGRGWAVRHTPEWPCQRRCWWWREGWRGRNLAPPPPSAPTTRRDTPRQ